MRILASGRARKCRRISFSWAQMCPLRSSTSLASSAAMRAAMSSAGRVALWALATLRAFWARLSVALFDAAISEVDSDPLASRPDGAGGLVAGNQLEDTPNVEVQRPLHTVGKRARSASLSRVTGDVRVR